MKINSSRRLAGAAVVGAVSVAVMLGSAGGAVAANARTVRPALTGEVTKKVNFTAPSGAQTSHSLSCPAGDIVTGGGAIPGGASTEVNLNSSYASGQAWLVWVNNTSGSSDAVTEYAVCVAATSIKEAQTVSNVVNLAAGEDSGLVAADCPSGLYVYGGGIYSSDSSLEVNITQSYPDKVGALWDASAENQAGKPDSITVYALCGELSAHYSGTGGTSVDNPAGAQTEAVSPTCPTGSKPISGGLASESDGPNVWLNGTGPNGTGAWFGYEDNNSSAETVITPAVICA